VESLLPFILVAVVLVVAVVVFSRRQRDTAELGSPVRLGPSWSPPEDDLADDPSAVALRERDMTAAKGAADLDERSVATTLEAWWEYLSVLGVRPLSRGHHYRFYDPYDPPATELGPDGRVPDPVRVARDVAQRTSVAEIDALAVLNAVSGAGRRAVSEQGGDDLVMSTDHEIADDRAAAEDAAFERHERLAGDVAPDDHGYEVRDDGGYEALDDRDSVLEDLDDVLDDPDDVLDDPDDALDDPDDALDDVDDDRRR
jgi:hypothetical protein